MKKEKSKSKSHETNIGKIIYGFLLFMPLIAIAVTCGYVMFNKNAYQSNNANYEIAEQKVNSADQLQINNNYTFNPKTFYDAVGNDYVTIGRFKYTTINVNWNDILPENQQLSNADLVRINNFSYYKAGNAYGLRLQENDTNIKTFQQLYAPYRINQTIYFDIVENMNINYGSYTRVYNTNSLYRIIMAKTSLQDIFYDSISKVESSNLFNWATNSIVYTTLTATCTALSINNTFIPLLLSYWLIISIIYILYDIALVMLIIFHRKVHELQECIW